MIDVLRELRTHLIDKGIVTSKQCKLNLYDTSPEVVCLWVYGGLRDVIGQSPTIQIKVLNTDNVKAENTIKKIFEEIISKKPARISTINKKRMKIVETQQPFFVEVDASKRFVWVFNITVTAF